MILLVSEQESGNLWSVLSNSLDISHVEQITNLKVSCESLHALAFPGLNFCLNLNQPIWLEDLSSILDSNVCASTSHWALLLRAGVE